MRCACSTNFVKTCGKYEIKALHEAERAFVRFLSAKDSV